VEVVVEDDPAQMTTKKKLIVSGLAFGALALVATFGIFLYRPATVTGVDGHQLGTSIAREIGRHAGDGSCDHASSDRWRCSIVIEPDPGSGGGDVAYLAKSNRWGCWQAWRVRQEPRRRSLHACIDLLDVLFPK